MFAYRSYGLRGLGATNAANTIASTIVQVEGVNPSYTPNNNPGNLVFVGQSGATLGAGGFAAFPTYTDGYNALLNQIQVYANQGLTIDQMMNKYAPAAATNDPTGVNNPNLYATYIANALGVPVTTPVADALNGTGTIATIDPGVTDTPDTTDAGTVTGLDPLTTLVLGAAAFLLITVMAGRK